MASKVPGMHSKSQSQRKAPPPSLWIPKSYEELNELLRTHPVQDGRYQRGVVQPAPGVLIKYKGDFAEEVCAMRYAHKHFSFPIPQILHHPSLRRGTPRGRYVPGRPVGVWYICMEQCPGVSLNNVIDAMTPAELNHVAEQLRQILAEMATIRPKTLGSVAGGPYRNSYVADSFPPTHAFTSVFELIDAYRYLLVQSQTCTESFTDALLSKFPRHAPIRFAHADLVPQNIIVNGSTITGIIDWAEAGFWPAYWEYCSMHDPRCSSPGWDQVLKLVFPGERRQPEIEAWHKLMTMLIDFF